MHEGAAPRCCSMISFALPSARAKAYRTEEPQTLEAAFCAAARRVPTGLIETRPPPLPIAPTVVLSLAVSRPPSIEAPQRELRIVEPDRSLSSPRLHGRRSRSTFRLADSPNAERGYPRHHRVDRWLQSAVAPAGTLEVLAGRALLVGGLASRYRCREAATGEPDRQSIYAGTCIEGGSSDNTDSSSWRTSSPSAVRSASRCGCSSTGRPLLRQ